MRNTITQQLKNYLFFSALFLMILGGFGFARGFIIATNSHSPGKTSEKLPLGELHNIAVDDSGIIYCALPFYSRVQVYNATGHFMYGLRIPVAGGSFQISLDNYQNLVVQAHNDGLYTFDKTGKLIGQSFNYYAVSFHPTVELKERLNPTYQIKNGFLFPRVIKILSNGKEKTIVTNTFFEWWLAGPFPAFIFFISGFVTLFLLLGLPAELMKIHRARAKKRPIIEV